MTNRVTNQNNDHHIQFGQMDVVFQNEHPQQVSERELARIQSELFLIFKKYEKNDKNTKYNQNGGN